MREQQRRTCEAPEMRPKNESARGLKASVQERAPEARGARSRPDPHNGERQGRYGPPSDGGGEDGEHEGSAA